MCCSFYTGDSRQPTEVGVIGGETDGGGVTGVEGNLREGGRIEVEREKVGLDKRDGRYFSTE